MENICNKKYASFLEATLRSIVQMPVSGICILVKLDDGSVCSDYYNSQMMDKIVYAGVIQQDIVWDTLKANNIVDKDSE